MEPSKKYFQKSKKPSKNSTKKAANEKSHTEQENIQKTGVKQQLTYAQIYTVPAF